ncbi:hypothetical protein AB4Y40_16205 [Paraburkholderia sp. EG287B]|uniref:hypothetical protein n=1 Tax=Paraburkholderia sp. EG287B TaxID=3237010 RepID=UPI0034D340D5
MARLDFIRACKSLALTSDVSNARQYAQASYGVRSELVDYFARASQLLDTTTITDPNAPPLSLRDGDFVGLVQRRSVVTLIDQALGGAGFRRVRPFVPLVIEDEGVVASWTKEAALKVIDADNAFHVTRLGVKKITALLVASVELVRTLDEATDLALQRDLARAISDGLNATLVSNDVADDSSPGGLLQGVTPIPSTGSLDGDVVALVDAFEGDLASAVLLMSPRTGVGFAFSGHDQVCGVRGGFVAGVPAIGVPGMRDSTLALIDAQRVLMFEGDLVPGSSTEAVVQIDDGTSGTQLFSLWQHNCVGLRAERFCNWWPLPGCAVWISDAGTTKIADTLKVKAARGAK